MDWWKIVNAALQFVGLGATVVGGFLSAQMNENVMKKEVAKQVHDQMKNMNRN